MQPIEDFTWIKLFRRSMNTRAFKNEGLWKVWTWCLMKANHSKSWVEIKTGRSTTEVEVGPGQFIFGRKSASVELSMVESTVWKRMQKLKNIENLTIESNSHYSIITILNWDTYQNCENKSNSKGNRQVTGKEQASNTDKNDNNVNNDKKGNTPLYPPAEKTWKTDFEIYRQECETSAQQLLNNSDWVLLQSELNPNVDIHKTMQKAYLNFWGTEAGWKHKKKSRTKSIDWKSTWQNAISNKMNRVYQEAPGKVSQRMQRNMAASDEAKKILFGGEA